MQAHPRNPDLFFASGPNVVTRHDRRTGLTQTRDIQVSPVYDRRPSGERISAIAPITFSHLNPDVIYTASQRLWRSQDGLSWEPISPDLTRAKSSGDDTRPFGTIFAIASSYHDANTIWVGTDDGLVQITRDGGKTWQRVTPPNLPELGRVSQIETSPHKAGTRTLQSSDLNMTIAPPTFSGRATMARPG